MKETIIIGLLALAAAATVAAQDRPLHAPPNTIIPVAVTNSGSTPLLVTIVGPHQQAFQETLHFSIPINGTTGSASLTVPTDGMRLVIEEVSVSATDNETTIIGKIQTSVAGNIADHFLPPFPDVGRKLPLTIVQTRRISADPGTTINASFTIQPGFRGMPQDTNFAITISGHIE